jgi:hypothetical protein
MHRPCRRVERRAPTGVRRSAPFDTVDPVMLPAPRGRWLTRQRLRQLRPFWKHTLWPDRRSRARAAQAARAARAPRYDHDRPPGKVKDLVRHAADRDVRQVGVSSGAEQDDLRVMLFSGSEDRLGYLADVSLPDLGIGVNALILKAHSDSVRELFRLAFRAVDLQPPETADRDFMHVQNDDLSWLSWQRSRAISTAFGA